MLKKHQKKHCVLAYNGKYPLHQCYHPDCFGHQINAVNLVAMFVKNGIKTIPTQTSKIKQ